MSDFVEAYDTRTGRKLPGLVPRSRLSHPVWGRHLSATPSAARRQTPQISPVPAAETPVIPVIRPVDTTNAPLAGDDEKENPDAEVSG